RTLAAARRSRAVTARDPAGPECRRARRRPERSTRDPLLEDAVAGVQHRLHRRARQVLLTLAWGGAEQAVMLAACLPVDARHHHPAVERAHGLDADDLEMDPDVVGVARRGE